jgi:Cu+-exporting ATPase
MTHATLTFAVSGMHCASCGLLIDDAVEELDGVQRCETDSRRGRTVVSADPTVTTVEAIVAAIADAGYRAEPVGG